MGAKHRIATAAAACATLLLAPGAAGAVDVMIGGHAQQCSEAAKAGKFDQLSLDSCTTALLGEPLFGRELAGTYVNRGTMYIALRNWGSALSDMNEALKIYPNMGEAYVNRGGALIGLRRFQEAVEEINKGIALNPSELEKAYGNRALAKWSLDDLRGAYMDFMKAQELKPEWTWPAEQLASFTVTPRQATAN